MWCRAILTAVAISYVICMLLLSGLQKDDLDANTLEKLGRHNVNIDDMNNEKLRQACILSSYLNSGNNSQKIVTETQGTASKHLNEPLETPATNNSFQNYVNVDEYPKLEMSVPENLEYKTTIQNKDESNTTGHFLKEIQKTININSKLNNIIENEDNLENLTKIEEKNGFQIEYVQNQPDLQSVMNFWTKLTHYTKKVVTKVQTTPASPYISEENNVTTVKVETSKNNGYVHSREIEYISRILAEYVASQTVSTTTQRTSVEKAYINFISRKTDDMLKKLPDKESDQITRTEFIKQQNLNKNNFTQVLPHEGIYNYMTYGTKSMPFTGSNNQEIKYKQQIKNVQDTPYNKIFTVQTKAMESPQYNPIKFLDNLLRTKHDDINNDHVPATKTSTTVTKLNSEHNEQEKSDYFNRPIINKNMKEVNDNNYSYSQNVMMDDDKFKNPHMEAERWEPIRSLRMTNNELEIIPIDKTRDQNTEINNLSIKKNWDQGERDGIYGQYKQYKNAVISHKNNSERLKRLESNTFDNAPRFVNKSNERQHFNLNDNEFKVIPMRVKTVNQDTNLETENGPFKSMFPAIKQPKQNQFEAVLAARNKSLRNQIPEMNYDQIENQPIVPIRWKPEAITHSNKLNENQLDKMKFPANVNKYQSIQDYKKSIAANIPNNTSNSEQNQSFVTNNNNNRQLVAIPIDVKELQPIKNFEINNNEPQVIPESIIREIAEKVKQIVLRDIEKKAINTTGKPPATTSTAVRTTTTTTMKTTVTTTEKSSTTPKVINEANHVIQKLMEIFKEFKLMKESTQSTTHSSTTPQYTSSTLNHSTSTLNYSSTLYYNTTKSPKWPIQPYPLQTPEFSPYFKTSPIIIKPIEASPYGPRMVPVPISSGANLPRNRPPQYLPVNFPQRSDYHSGAITIQTNSDEIAPLAIQILKPIRLMNQHIIVTTKSPAETLKKIQERESIQRFDQKFKDLGNVMNHREKNQVKADFTKKVRFSDNHKMHEYSDRYTNKLLNNGREKPWHARGYSGIRHRMRSHGYNEQDHQHSRFDSTKFHEKLERIENWPRNDWKEDMYMTTEECCQEIPSRQQVPLTKVKHRTRFDDTHFTNFLKSQQKVTDMLEKILANNIKNSGARSVETP